MIPITEIIPQNLYSQDDGPFLLGDGFTKKASREVICEACRSNELQCRQWRRRFWFTGADFLSWVSAWSGLPVPSEPPEKTVATHRTVTQNDATNPEPVAGGRKGGGR